MKLKIATSLLLMTMLLSLVLTSCVDKPTNNPSDTSVEAGADTQTSEMTYAPESTGTPETTGAPDNAAPIELNEGDTLLSSAIYKVPVSIDGEMTEMRVRVAVIGSPDVTLGNKMTLELLDNDGNVTDIEWCVGLGFISIKKSETGLCNEFALYGILVKEDKTFNAGVYHCYISNCDNSGKKLDKPIFCYLEDNESTEGSVGSTSAMDRKNKDFYAFSSAAGNILRHYIGMPIIAYSSADKYGTPKDNELLYTETINEQITLLSIYDIADLRKD